MLQGFILYSVLTHYWISAHIIISSLFSGIHKVSARCYTVLNCHLHLHQLFLVCVPDHSGCAKWCSASNLEHFSFNYAWETIVMPAGQLPLLHQVVSSFITSLNTGLWMVKTVDLVMCILPFYFSVVLCKTYQIWYLICKYIITSSFCWGLGPTQKT